MKGMDQILRGFSFLELLRYCQGRGGKQGVPKGRLIGGNMSGRTVRSLVREFVSARRLRPDIKKATWHNSLRLPPGDAVSDAKWCEVVAEYMTRMGFSPLHPYCIWAHDDESAVHIAACRIAFDGSVYLGQNENLASTRHIQDLERLFGLRLTKGPEYVGGGPPNETSRVVMPMAKRLTKAEQNRSVRTGCTAPKVRLQRIIDKAVEDRPTVVGLVERLTAEGILVRANLATTGGLSGFSFMLDGDVFKGSALGKGYGWTGLQARGVTYEEARDRDYLEQFGPAAGSSPTADSVDPAAVPTECGQQDADVVEAPVEGVESARGGDAMPGDRAVHAVSGPSYPLASSVAEAVQPPGVAPIGAGGPPVRGPDLRETPMPDLRVKLDAWRLQSRALGAPGYHVTLICRSGPAQGRAMNLGKPKAADQSEVFYTAEEVEQLIPELRWRNASGYDVYVTPIDPQHHYIVIDDMKPGAVVLLEGLGHAPCVVQSSSAGNEQAVLKVPRFERDDEQALANQLVWELNAAHGDPTFSDVIRPFRMAGFSNNRPGRANAFTTLIKAVPRLCRRAAEMLRRLRAAADRVLDRRRHEDQERRHAEKARQLDRRQRESVRQSVVAGHDADALAAFRDASERVRRAVVRRGLPLDASRVDFQAAKRMLRQGWHSDQVIAGMLAGSIDLAGRHPRPGDYVARTVVAAEAALDREASEACDDSRALRPRGG